MSERYGTVLPPANSARCSRAQIRHALNASGIARAIEFTHAVRTV